MEQRISIVTLGVSDLAASRCFYADGLGWKPVFENKEIVFFQAGGMIFALFLRAKDENGTCASVYHDEGRFECRTKWTSLSLFTTASTLVTWRRCSQPCTRMSFGQMAWKAVMSMDATKCAATGHVSGRWSIRTLSQSRSPATLKGKWLWKSIRS